MSIQNLEALKALGSLMDLITNPKKYQEIIDEAKKVTAEFYASAGVLHSVKEVKAYKAQLDVEYARRDQEIKSAFASLEREKVVVNQTRQEVEAIRLHSEAQSKERDYAVSQREQAVSQLEAVKTQLTKDQVALTQAIKELEQQKIV